jgi:stress response protein YsnF
MARNTVVAVFEISAEAERAKDDLVNAGFDHSSIRVTSNEPATATAGESSTVRVRGSSDSEHEGFGERIGHFFSSLFGSHEHRDDATHYADAVRRGSAVVTVDAHSEEEADRAADILDERGVVDIQRGAQTGQPSAWAGSAAPAAGVSSRDVREENVNLQGERVIPVVQEELQVAKRRRERGGVRIYTHAEEERVEENVRLRDEHARVERRPVDRPATEADLTAFKEGTIEVRETIEEPVVAKKARVVEEVVVAKEITERTETVRDSVLNGQVEVEQLDTARAADASMRSTKRAAGAYDQDDDADYRRHWQTNYAGAGGTYDDYQPAYQYGSTLGQDKRYQNRGWNDIESDARRDWETRHPGNAWDKFKASVRHGWERVTGKR